MAKEHITGRIHCSVHRASMRYVSPQYLEIQTWVPRVRQVQGRELFWRARSWCKETATWGWSYISQSQTPKRTITDDWIWRRTCRSKAGRQITCYLVLSALLGGFRLTPILTRSTFRPTRKLSTSTSVYYYNVSFLETQPRGF